jgi:hypothetical protein
MKIFVATAGWDREGFDILAICDTKKGAQAAIKQAIKQAKKECKYDYYDIQTHKLIKEKE